MEGEDGRRGFFTIAEGRIHPNVTFIDEDLHDKRVDYAPLNVYKECEIQSKYLFKSNSDMPLFQRLRFAKGEVEFDFF